MKTSAERNSLFLHFVKRNAKLYFGWFIILLPITLHIRQSWFDDGGYIVFLRSFFLDSTFIASWFITALVLSVGLVFILSRRIGNSLLLVIGFLCYIWCVLASSYPSIWRLMNHGLVVWNPAPQFSFMSSLLWIVLGKIIAENASVLKMPLHWTLVGCALFGLTFWVEWVIVRNATGQWKNDCYFCLAPLCFYIFVLLMRFHMKCSYSRALRSFSVMIFVLHGSLLAFIPSHPLKYFPHVQWKLLFEDKSNLFPFVTVLSLCYLSYKAICRLERKWSFFEVLH